jgi:hypothetical protein
MPALRPRLSAGEGRAPDLVPRHERDAHYRHRHHACDNHAKPGDENARMRHAPVTGRRRGAETLATAEIRGRPDTLSRRRTR